MVEESKLNLEEVELLRTFRELDRPKQVLACRFVEQMLKRQTQKKLKKE